MALEIYVGNYPAAFTPDDLLNLFQDFKGIEMVRNKNANGKCFSFLRCMNESQIIDIVTTMHDIDVCGRNLIVRASNEELQNLIVEELLENDVLDKHPRNIHHSHLGVNQNSNVQKNFKRRSSDEVVSDFPIGMRFINPRLQSLHVEKKSDSVDQQRSSSRLSEYHHKSPTQPKCEKECFPPQQNLPIHGIGVSKYNDSSQNVSQNSNKHNTMAQDFSGEEASYPNHRQFKNYTPGRQNFVDSTTERNLRFITPRFQAPHVGKNDYINYRNHDSQISTTAHMKSTKEVFKNPYQSSSSVLGTGVSKHTSSYQNSSKASYKPDAGIQNFPDGGASIHKYELQHCKSSSPGKQSHESSNSSKQNIVNRAKESYNSGKQDVVIHANESSNPSKQNVANYVPESSKQNVVNHANESSKSRKQNVAICTNESRYDAKGGDFSHLGSSSGHHRDNFHNILNDDKEIDGAFRSQSSDEPVCSKDIFYVSVINFPFNTSIRDLYYLFEDFDPFNIIMICNVPMLNRKPTEAILCFESQDQATDAILNFDNTFYHGRALVVADTTDLTMVPALLSMGLRDI